MQNLSCEAFASLDDLVVTAAPVPEFRDLYNDDQGDFQKLPPFELKSLEVPALICHSSGMCICDSPV